MAIGDPVTCIIGREKQIITNPEKTNTKWLSRTSTKLLAKHNRYIPSCFIQLWSSNYSICCTSNPGPKICTLLSNRPCNGRTCNPTRTFSFVSWKHTENTECETKSC
jgi:hypothetical protein